MAVEIILTDKWRREHPGALVGFVHLTGVANPKSCPPLDQAKAAVEADLRAAYPDRAAIKADPVVAAYIAYYKNFKKTYHVLQQVETVAVKGRPIPSIAALVEAMFMAELKNRMLTAGHDVSRLEGPITVNSASGEETFVNLSGKEQTVPAGDQYMADQVGIISAIVRGADRRTALNPATTEALFTAYAPAEVGRAAVTAHLEDIAAFCRLVASDARTEMLVVHQA